MWQDDITIELARVTREAYAAIHAKMAAQQLGEAFCDLPVETVEEDDYAQAA